jgi:antitoxin component YwqK of YwqJK toxin-antitoxin module
MLKKILFFALIALFSACNNLEKATETDSNGMKSEFYRDAKTKLKEGDFTRFYPSGAKFEEAHYSKDSLDGERKTFYENGKIQTLERYKNGQYEGVFKSYYDDGSLQQEGQYVKNEMSGELKTYYKGGQVKEIVMMAHNLENGPFKEFYENGKIKAEGFYRNGDTENGELREYNSNGELTKIKQCDEGICRTTWATDSLRVATH